MEERVDLIKEELEEIANDNGAFAYRASRSMSDGKINNRYSQSSAHVEVEVINVSQI